ncbi:MAG TPA: YfhO family protein, partial [Candidatus Hydrogenedentes bacterium]|nr:YfhO family protein [Candidatus Hydrogenedentota bacterium]
ALALLAFSAAEEWLELDPDQCHEAVRRFFFMLPALLGAALILWAIHLSGERPHAPRFTQQIVWFGIVCAITLGLLGFTIFKPWGRFLGYSLACVGFCELYAAFHGALVFTPRDRVFPETPFIRALKSAGVRVGGSGALMGWPLAGNLVHQAYGASGVTLKRHAQFVQQLSEKPLLVRRMGAPALLLTKQDVLGPFASVRPLLQVKHVFSSGTLLFDDLGARPRAWMAYEGRDSNRFDPALLSPTDPPLIELSAPPTSGAGPEAQAQIDPSSTNTEVLVRVTDTRPGVLVLTDAWYPGWQVTVDGVKTAVLPVDGAFRGVSLEKGPHEILFSYVPQSYRLGKQISAAACLLVALGMLHFSVLDIRDRRLLRVQWSDES